MKDVVVKDRKTLQAIIGNITMANTSLDFKWRFEIEDAFDGWFLQVAFERPDTNTGINGIGRGRKEYVEQGTSESGVVKTCWLLIELVIRHELMEAFRYCDKRIFNPHNSVHALMSIQE